MSTRLLYSHCRARTGVAKRLPAFDSLCGARMRVAKHVLAFDGLCGARTRVAKCVPAFDSLCGAQTGVAKYAIAFDSSCGGRIGTPKCLPDNPCGARTGVRKCLLAFNRPIILTSIVFVIIDLSFEQILQLFKHPLFPGKSLIIVFHRVQTLELKLILAKLFCTIAYAKTFIK